jgi:hypothetical protein
VIFQADFAHLSAGSGMLSQLPGPAFGSSIYGGITVNAMVVAEGVKVASEVAVSLVVGLSFGRTLRVTLLMSGRLCA